MASFENLIKTNEDIVGTSFSGLNNNNNNEIVEYMTKKTIKKKNKEIEEVKSANESVIKDKESGKNN